MQLYKLTKQFQEVQDLSADMDVGDTLDAISMEIEEKARNIGFVFKNMDAQEKIIADEIKSLQNRKKAISNRRDRLKNYLRENMIAYGVTKIECDLFSISCVGGSDVVVIDDEKEIPKEFIKVVESVDKTALLKALKDGPVSGARIGKSKDSIRIS